VSLDYGAARSLLDHLFSEAEQDLLRQTAPSVPESLTQQFETVFRSNTQAYREVLVGCAIARLQDRSINIRLPYVKPGADAFNGRTLDEKVVNPFLRDNRIPSSAGPYLGVFRRSVTFTEATREGLRDRPGYDAFLALITYLEGTQDEGELPGFLSYLLFKFAQLREAASIPLNRLQRISLEQYDALIAGLLATPSGGRFPVLLVLAAFRAIRDFFGVDWTIECQGINVADAAAGAGGDITVRSGQRVLLAAEITERPVDRNRVVATFSTKIAPNAIEDYLFFISLAGLDEAARTQAQQYFAQGHEVNFLEIKDWILMSLATMGTGGRAQFNQHLLELLDTTDVPQPLKMAWNAQLNRLVGG